MSDAHSMDSTGQARAGANTITKTSGSSFEDVLIPAIPGTITSLILEAVNAFNGIQKISIATLAGLTLWILVRRRSGEKKRLTAAVRQHWRWAVVGIAGLALLALVFTVLNFGRPTPATVAVSTLTLTGLSATAAGTGRRVPAAITAAVSGGTLGLCVGIALL
jgi:hypothetical protein